VSHPFLFWRTWCIVTCLPLPARWHRFLTDWQYARRVSSEAVRFPVQFCRDAAFRAQWLTGEVESGAAEGLLTETEKDAILSNVPDPFFQKYLKSIAVHMCALPVTQIVSACVAVWGGLYLGETWLGSFAYGAAIWAAFQLTPVSVDSLACEAYVVYLMIRERDWRSYRLAALVSFWHYVDSLGFPLQMVKDSPALARCMAGRWAAKIAGIVPVFGKRGALLEHWIFDTFCNVPLSLKRSLTQPEVK
jgi:hypothetical protein